MSKPSSGRLALLWRFLRSWYLPAAVGLLLLIALAIWIMPRRLDRVVSADGRHQWDAGQVSQRQVLWEPPQSIEGLLPEGEGSLITPRLADGGATFYFTYRPRGQHADIYRSRLVDGTWQRAEPVAELNTEADDIGPALSHDGRQLYLYSNRPGGQGGFDLYVSERAGAGWSKPRNLGPRINSPAHEYDPAPSPDGLALYFASNRTPGMAAPPPAQPATGENWAGTLRAHPGLPQFDLYAARRLAPQDDWSTPEALNELNSSANEGAPFLSPSGNFLYFASDRPARPRESPNLDLYRARLVDGRFRDVENLGPGINTSAHETEPALSPEGFTLFFSSDRDGANGLYRSTAQEVYARTEWDTSNLQAVAAVWWQALLLTLLLVGVLATLLFSRGWLFEKATAARFVAASLMIHALVVFLMGVVPLAKTVIRQAEEIRASEQTAQVFDDSPHSAHQDGRPSYQKVLDLKTMEPVPLSPVARQTVEPPNLPERRQDPGPTLPVPVARVMPVELQPSVPAREEPTLRPASDLPRRTRAQPPEMAAVPPVPAEPAPPEVGPDPARLTGPAVAQARQDPIVPAPAALELPRRSSQSPGRPAAIEINPAAEKPEVMVQAPAAPLGSRHLPARAAEPARTSEKVEVVAQAPPPDPKALDPQAASVSLGRREDVGPAPLGGAARLAAMPSPAVRTGTLDLPPSPDGEAPRLAPLATLPARGVSRPRLDPNVAAAPVDPGPIGAVPPPAPGEKPLVGAQVSLPRPDAVLPDAPARTPEKMTGPPSQERDRLLLGRADFQSVPARMDGLEIRPTTFRLTRPPASGTRVARADDGDMTAYLLRQAEVRKESIDLLGGTKESEAAVERGLDWLAAHQNRDGSWSLQGFTSNCKHPQCTAAAAVTSDTAGTGLALLPFLAAGYTHKAGKHQQTVGRGVKWLTEQQRVDGGWLAPGDGRPMYGHGLAAIALCEAFGMTKDPQLHGPAQKALDFIVRGQHAASGGWRYQPNTPGDTSVLGWQVMALKSGELAGLTVPPQALEGAQRWLKSVEGNQPVGGLFGYQTPTPTPAMTAQGLLCLQLMGARRSDPRLVAGADYLLRNLPQRNVDTSYYWYHATQVMYHMQGKYWKAWNERLRDLLVSTQITQGPMSGTWDPVDAREKTGGRICSTALRLLMLEVYYRHLPLYQQLEK